MTITDVKTQCTTMYSLLSGYLDQAAAADGYRYFENNATTIINAVLSQTRTILREAVSSSASSPDDAPEIWNIVTICNAAVQDTLSFIDAKNSANKNPTAASSIGTIRWLINTTTK